MAAICRQKIDLRKMPIKTSILTAKPDTDILSLSVSKVKTFKDCKAKFKFSYIEKLPRKDWEHLIFGKFLHEVLENFHKKLMDGSQTVFPELMTECFKQSIVKWKDKINPTQSVEAYEILCIYLKQITEQKNKGVLPTILSVEKDFFIDIDGRVLLNGFIDRIQQDPDGILHVSDYKTTKKKEYLKKDYFQLLTYAYVMCLEDPTLQKVRTSYILLRHNFETIIKEYSRDEVMKVEQKFLDYADSINAEKLYRPNPTPLCPFCDYLDICDAGKKRNENFDTSKFGALDW